MSYETLSQNSPEARSASPIPDNVEALAKLFPSVVQDGQVDFDALKTLLGEAIEEDDKERFGLHWHGKKEARRFAMEPSLGTLRPCREESVDWDTTKNLYIEGDNLEVLKLLRKSYSGKVKMIYIDPPYNTGEDFVYQDNYSDSIGNYKRMTGQCNSYKSNLETSGRFHTNWLNMMYPRLQIARDLLTEDGVIFISIDDNEVYNLQICTEIFGEANFVAQFPWRKRTAKSDVPFGVSQDYEWVICYARSNRFVANIEGGGRKYYETPDFPGRPWRIHDLTTQRTASERPNSYFTIVNPVTGEEYPANPNQTWRITEETFKEYYAANRIVFPNDYDFLKISRPVLRYWKDDDIQKAGDNFGRVAVSTKLPQNIGMSQDGTKEITNLFKGKVFSFPKPTSLVKFLATIINAKDAIYLDFFSGSATTAHAVMQMNAEDGGNRKFIMVQLPELCYEKSEAYKAGYKNICEIGKERIRRAGKKIKEEAGLPGQKLDVGFRVYKLDNSNVRVWNPEVNEEDLVEAMNRQAEHLVAGRTSEDFLTEIMLKCGIDLVEQIEEREIEGHKVQSLGYGQYYACMDNDIAKDVERLAHGIVEWHAEETRQAGVDASDTCTVFVLDQAFDGKDAAKMNFVAILEQYGIHNVKAF